MFLFSWVCFCPSLSLLRTTLVAVFELSFSTFALLFSSRLCHFFMFVHFTFIEYLANSLLWNASIFSDSVAVTVQVPELYKNIDSTHVAKVGVFDLMVSFWLKKIQMALSYTFNVVEKALQYSTLIPLSVAPIDCEFFSCVLVDV